MKKNQIQAMFLFLAIIFCKFSYGLNVTDEPYVKGSVLAQRYQNIINHYRKSGLSDAEYIQTENFLQFFSMAKNNQFDVIFASNVNARVLIEKYQYIPILVRDSSFKAVVITGVDNGLKSINDLVGHKVFSATVFDPSSYIARNTLKDIELDVVELSEVSKVIMKVISGEGKVGFIADVDIRHLAKSLRDQIRILITSEKTFTSYVLISNKNKDRQKKIKDVVASFYTSPLKEEVEDIWGKFGYVELDEKSLQNLYDSDNDQVMEKILELIKES